MLKTIHFRTATSSDLGCMSQILVEAALASGVQIHMNDLATNHDAYQYLEGFPQGADVGIIAETHEGDFIGAAWVRLLPTAAHAIDKHLPELTMGIMAKYRQMGMGKCILEELYKAALSMGISEISLGVHKDNVASIKLYTKQHWIKDGHFGEYIMMSRKIAG